VKPITLYTCKLTDEQATQLKTWMDGHQYEPYEVAHARFAGKREKTNIVFYNSGKLVVQGKGTHEFVEFFLEPEILKQATLGYEEELDPDFLLPRFGIDESGKGDFFGPLVSAGVYVNGDAAKSLKEAGIQDSKKIGSDKRIRDLADIVKATRGCVISVVPVGPEAYNRLYLKMRSVNTLLAWSHARVIENLMGQQYRMPEPPVKAISDQFARSKSTVAKALMAEGRKIELVQRHKAEADIAVAAASIIARHEFVTRLKKLGDEFGIELPKGASQKVIDAGREIVAKHGPEVLAKVSKQHFKTTQSVLG